MANGTIARAIHRDRRRAGVEACDMQAAGAHRFDLGRVRLHREEHDLFAGDLLRVLEEAVPHLGVERRVLDRRVGEDQRRRIDQLLRIGRRVGDQVAVAVAVGLVEIAARTILRARASRRRRWSAPRRSRPAASIDCSMVPPCVPPPCRESPATDVRRRRMIAESPGVLRRRRVEFPHRRNGQHHEEHQQPRPARSGTAAPIVSAPAPRGRRSSGTTVRSARTR